MKQEVLALFATINVEIVPQMLPIVIHVLILTDLLPLHVDAMPLFLMMELLHVKLVYTHVKIVLQLLYVFLVRQPLTELALPTRDVQKLSNSQLGWLEVELQSKKYNQVG